MIVILFIALSNIGKQRLMNKLNINQLSTNDPREVQEYHLQQMYILPSK